jgi:hypothetical protein
MTAVPIACIIARREGILKPITNAPQLSPGLEFQQAESGSVVLFILVALSHPTTVRPECRIMKHISREGPGVANRHFSKALEIEIHHQGFQILVTGKKKKEGLVRHVHNSYYHLPLHPWQSTKAQFLYLLFAISRGAYVRAGPIEASRHFFERQSSRGGRKKKEEASSIKVLTSDSF